MPVQGDTKRSKFLSLILRHKPEEIGLTLDAEGWAEISEIMAKAPHGYTPAIIQRLVAESDKQRFILSEDGTKIRANQGHSIKVDLGLEPIVPPAILYHGTAEKSLAAIRAEGLIKRGRQHVHLSADTETATKVGQRHGSPVVLTVAASQMAEAGQTFYRSENGVWLTDHVPPAFLGFPNGK